MHFIQNNIKWIMLAGGALTCTMALAIVAPELALQRSFGATLQGPLADVVVRSWGMLITLVGAMLIYAAFRPVHRTLVLLVAVVSKAMLLILIAGPGREFAGTAMPVIVADGLIVLIFLVYLLSVSARQHNAPSDSV
ncbi:MAG: hypothetical protein Q8L06_11320 [Pseudohongiella sp.]|nr:hypothetical protein [Pseudohongiella sp.]